MPRHSWQDWEMLETLRIARLPRRQWPTEIVTLTQAIRERTDPLMDRGRVLVAVQAAENLMAGRDWGPSERLRFLYEEQQKKKAGVPASAPTLVRRRQLSSAATAITAPQTAPDWSPTQHDRERLLAFEGYGVASPDFVFVGLEEYCDPDPTLQRENIRRRCTASAYGRARVDKNNALNALDGLVKTTVPVWDMIAKLIASLTERSWQIEHTALGSCPAHHRPSTLLTELRALPRPGTSFEWQGSYLAEWFSVEFSGRRDFERKAEQLSGQRILHMLEQENGPLIVFFYGEPTRRWASTQLASILRSDFDDSRISVAQTHNGTFLISTGFYNGQHAETAFREQDIPHLVSRVPDFVRERVRAVVTNA